VSAAHRLHRTAKQLRCVYEGSIADDFERNRRLGLPDGDLVNLALFELGDRAWAA